MLLPEIFAFKILPGILVKINFTSSIFILNKRQKGSNHVNVIKLLVLLDLFQNFILLYEGVYIKYLGGGPESSTHFSKNYM